MPKRSTDANLTPIKPGQVLNPTGVNQYTGRTEALRALDQLACELRRGKTTVERIVAKLLREAEAGKPWAMRLVCERILPVVHQIEHSVPEPVSVEDLLRKFEAIRHVGQAAPVPPEELN